MQHSLQEATGRCLVEPSISQWTYFFRFFLLCSLNKIVSISYDQVWCCPSISSRKLLSATIKPFESWRDVQPEPTQVLWHLWWKPLYSSLLNNHSLNISSSFCGRCNCFPLKACQGSWDMLCPQKITTNKNEIFEMLSCLFIWHSKIQRCDPTLNRKNKLQLWTYNRFLNYWAMSKRIKKYT